MCLTHVDPKPRRRFSIGYKSVEKLKDGTYTCYDHLAHAGTVKYPLSQWIVDPNDGKADTPVRRTGYRTGFHISLDKEATMKLSRSGITAIIKVKFRKVVATQIDHPDHLYGRQVVARELMNLGEVLS